MNVHLFKQSTYRIVSISSILLFMILAFSDASAEVPATPTPWRDDFNAASLDPAWEWVNENPDNWSLTGEYLRILASPYPTGDENLLLRPIEPGDFSIETRLLFEPDTNFQIAGLVIYQDGTNFLQFGRAFCDAPDACVGNGIYFDKILDGGSPDGNFATGVDDPTQAYLRLERRGEMVRGLYSYEGITWFEIGTHWIPAEFQVNGVGLTASQDFNTPEVYIPADFDYFELSEDGGFLPEGYHDYDQGDVPSWACNAGGWAVDPDDREADIWVEINVDGALLDTISADQYREDLEATGGCVGGTCGFFSAMWGDISAYEPHIVSVYAQDISSGEWVRLSTSPKPLTCRTQDIYSYNSHTRTTTQITDLRDSDEYNPSWSPDGEKVAYDRLFADGSFGIYITNLTHAITSPLVGAEDGGNDAAWSPNGEWIAFDRFYVDDPNLYLVSSGGGDRTLLRNDAISADWSPNGQWLVFHQPSDGSLRTINLITKQENYLTANGANPAWSPNGRWIAYDDSGDIWKIAVNFSGVPQSEPVRLTGTPGGDGQPTWSADSKTIAYHSGLSRDYNIWTIPATGGMGAWLTGGIEFGDYDPDYSRNMNDIAYSSFTPEGQAPRDWHVFYTYDLPAGYWDEGTHMLYFEWAHGERSEDHAFDVSSQEPIYDGYALLRATHQRARIGDTCEFIDRIHPDQLTKFHFGWADFGMTYPEVLVVANGLNPKVAWDGEEAVPLLRYEIFPLSSEIDVFQYVCSFTYPPVNRTVAIGNFRLDWSPTNPEEITGLQWKNSVNLTNTSENPACMGDLEYFGNSWVSENEGTPDFFFNSLVGWSMSGTWSHNSTLVDIASKSSKCPASAEIPIQTDYKIFGGAVKTNLLAVLRSFDFGESPYDHNIRPFIPRLYPLNGYTQVLHPDASGLALITEITGDCGYGCKVTDWNGTWFAIHNPDNGMGMIVYHVPSPYSIALWLDEDSASFTNASSVLLLPPPGGFTGPLIEIEFIYFYDSDTWAPSMKLPSALSPENLNMDDPDYYKISIPLVLR